MSELHRPVMLEEVMEYLAPSGGDLIVDGTLGLGGHGVEIMKRLAPGGTLLGIDRDSVALELAEKRLARDGTNFRLFQGTYDQLPAALATLDRPPEGAIDGFLLDLGVSSMQLDQANRGFSFQRDGPLDMRMDQAGGESAAEFLARVSCRELEEVLRRYGEERAARRIAMAIDRYRQGRDIESTAQLASIVESVMPRGGKKIHPATRTFQGIRIAINRELELLRQTLRDLDRYLSPGGRVVVLSYHSLEDGIVKRVLGQHVKDGLYRWAFRGVQRPTEVEIESNPRARSARLRSAVRAG